MYLREAIEFGRDSTSWVHFPVNLVTKSSCLFDVSECLYEFVGGVFVEDSISTGVCQKGKFLVSIILLVNNHHSYPLVCCKYHPCLVFPELLDGPAFLHGKVRFCVGAVIPKQMIGIRYKFICLPGGESGTCLFNCCNVGLLMEGF